MAIVAVLLVFLFTRKSFIKVPTAKLVSISEIDSIKELDSNKYFNRISGLCILNDKLYLSDANTGRIIVCNLELGLVKAFGKKGQGPGEFMYPCSIRNQINIYM